MDHSQEGAQASPEDTGVNQTPVRNDISSLNYDQSTKITHTEYREKQDGSSAEPDVARNDVGQIDFDSSSKPPVPPEYLEKQTSPQGDPSSEVNQLSGTETETLNHREIIENEGKRLASEIHSARAEAMVISQL